jgi:hypothetical protein
MALFGRSHRHAGAPPPVPTAPAAPVAPVLGAGAPPPPGTAEAGSFATLQAIQAARRARRRATAKPTIIGAASPHLPPVGSFVGRSLLGY